MREIKFRGKDLKTGKWVYGDLLHIGGGCIIYHGSQTETDVTNKTKGIELLGEEISVVSSDTVGQFTGLRDFNGQEIYEGDIVEQFTMECYRQEGDYPPPNIEVEEWYVKRNVNPVKYDYGAFEIGNSGPMQFYFMYDYEEDYEEKRQFNEIWENNYYEIRQEYPYLTWENFLTPRVIGNIHDNPELLEGGAHE